MAADYPLSTKLSTEQESMRTLYSLVLLCAVLCCGCSTVETPSPGAIPDSSSLQAEPRGIVGETCPPALAAKGYC